MTQNLSLRELGQESQKTEDFRTYKGAKGTKTKSYMHDNKKKNQTTSWLLFPIIDSIFFLHNPTGRFPLHRQDRFQQVCQSSQQTKQVAGLQAPRTTGSEYLLISEMRKACCEGF
jgi:hypothetical protein